MNFLIYYFLPFVVVLGILIFFHELGHFLVAKYFNVKVLRFSLGFGYKLVGKKIGETEYLISTHRSRAQSRTRRTNRSHR